MRVLVIGGTGVISRAIVTELAAGNHEVTVINRGRRSVRLPDGVEELTGDRGDWESFSAVLKGRRFDAVIDMICFTPEDAARTVELFRDMCDHLVICSSIAAYRRPYKTVPVQEDREELWTDPSFQYGYQKAEMERFLADVTEGPPVTLVRPSLTFGEGARNVGVLRQNMNLVDRIRRGRPLVMFGDGTAPWSFTFAPDLARGFVGLLGKKASFGQAYHITSEERRLWRDLYLELGQIVGREPRLVYIPSQSLFQAMPDLFQHIAVEKSHPGLFDNSKIRTVIPEFRAKIDLKAGLEALIESWERDGLEPEPEKDQLEDRLAAVAEDTTNRLRELASAAL